MLHMMPHMWGFVPFRLSRLRLTWCVWLLCMLCLGRGCLARFVQVFLQCPQMVPSGETVLGADAEGLSKASVGCRISRLVEDAGLKTRDACDFELDTRQTGCLECRRGGPVDDRDGVFGIEGRAKVVGDEVANCAEAEDVDVHVAGDVRGDGERRSCGRARRRTWRRARVCG